MNKQDQKRLVEMSQETLRINEDLIRGKERNRIAAELLKTGQATIDQAQSAADDGDYLLSVKLYAAGEALLSEAADLTRGKS